MKKEKHLLFTFDYELFLGERSGNVIDSVIEPTQHILNLLEEYNIKAIFFVDTTWLIKLKELSENCPACKNKLQLISSQIINIVKQGHDVFPHLHPHWMDAVYDPQKDEFNLQNITHYRINQLNQEEINKVFDSSIAILRDIIHFDFPEYKIELSFLRKKGLWIHCKNIEALKFCKQYNIENNYFYHQNDDVVLTSNGYFWTYPGKKLTEYSIAVLPELKKFEDIQTCFGICTDFVLNY